MSGSPYPIFFGVPMPAPMPRGRKKGSRDQMHGIRQAAIAKGVGLRKSGKPLLAAARDVLEHSRWNVTPQHLARLISVASTNNG